MRLYSSEPGCCGWLPSLRATRGRPRIGGSLAVTVMAQTTVLLRNRAAANAGRVSFLELVYDLVFVFAITQLSQLLLHHYTPMGAVETALLMLANGGTGSTPLGAELARSARRAGAAHALSLNAARPLHVDVDPGGVRLARPDLRARLCGDEVGRTLFVIWCLAGDVRARYILPAHRRVAGRVGAGRVFGGLAEGEARLALWGLALGMGHVGRGLITGCRGLVAPPPWTGTFSASTSPNAAGSSSSSASARRC